MKTHYSFVETGDHMDQLLSAITTLYAHVVFGERP